MKKKTLPIVYLTVLTIIIYIPVIVAVVYSFNASKLSSVWGGFTLNWYKEVFKDKSVIKAVSDSLFLGLSSSVLSAIIAVSASLGFSRTRFKLSKFVKWTGMIPLMIPEVIFGVAYLSFFRLLNLKFGMTTLVIAHMSFCIPYVFLQVETRVATMDNSPSEAARIMGASPVRAFWDVTLPYLLPAVISGMFLSFAMSFDDVVVSMFVTSANVNTLALKIYSQVKTTVTPKVNAICSLMLAGTLLCLFIAAKVAKLQGEKKDE